jgi:glycosyltransferase involved in cell wall biosynthesis
VNQPAVAVAIPTYNSAAALARCLDAVAAQTYPYVSTVVVDGGSTDDTLAIAQRYGVQVVPDRVGLLNARKVGVAHSTGEYVLLLDSDQILEPDAIARAVAMAEGGGPAGDAGPDMLVFEEDVYRAETFLERLFQLDRRLIHAVRDFSPFTGVMLPRFYRRELLERVFEAIPVPALGAGGQDHAIIYYEAWQLTQRVDLVLRAVRHVEPSAVRQIVPKFYRWGYTSRNARNDRYAHLLGRKEAFRKGMFTRGLVVASLGSICLLLIKGVPYKLGVLASRLPARQR